MLLAAVFLGTVSGCGKKEPAAEQTADEGKDTVDSNGADTREAEPTKGEQEPEEVKGPDAETCKKAYEDFLNDREPLYFDLGLEESCERWIWTDMRSLFPKDTPVVFSEYMSTYWKAESESAGVPMRPLSIEYSIIDCGLDGIPELAMCFESELVTGDHGLQFLVIKLIDDRLQLIADFQQGGYSYGELKSGGIFFIEGSDGSPTYYTQNIYVGPDGQIEYVYGETEYYTPRALYIPDHEDAADVADAEGIDYGMWICRLYTKEYEDEAGDYGAFLKNDCAWYFTALTNEQDPITDPGVYEKGSPWMNYWDSTGLPLSTREEVETMKKERLLELEITDEIWDAPAVEWKALSPEQSEIAMAWAEDEPQYVQLSRPSWEYACDPSCPAGERSLDLALVSKKANEIIDDYAWFDEVGWTYPGYEVFRDDVYEYRLSGEDNYYFDRMEIFDLRENKVKYLLDFSAYVYPDEYVPADWDFIQEGVRWAQCVDDILYVSTYHRTYAASAPQNGYITAYDMKDRFKVLWRSEPLTCNSANFLVFGDTIICGYGFTAEDDFVYILDRMNGKRTATYPVKSGPDYFYEEGGQLFVRTYNTDYVYNIKER